MMETPNATAVIRVGKPVQKIRRLKVTGLHKLEVRFAEGGRFQADLAGMIHKFPPFEPLKDTELFARIQIINDGGGIGWPNGLDYSAESLRSLVEGQLDMTGAEFGAWVSKHGLSNAEAADALGLGRSTVLGYKTQDKVSLVIKVACTAMAQDPGLLFARVKPRKVGKHVGKDKENEPPN